MLTLAANDTLSGGASVASQLTCTVFGMELASGTETYKILDQRQLASSPATIYTATAVTAFIRSIHIVNNDTAARTFQLFVNVGAAGVTASDAITPLVSVPAGGWATYEDGDGWRVYDANGAVQQQVPNIIGVNSIAALAADVSNSTTTVAAIAGLDLTLAAGTWIYRYYIRYQAAATTTGVKFAVDHTGTVTAHIYNMYGVDTTATASDGAMDQDANASTGQVLAAYAARADNVTLGPTLSVDTINADMLMVIEGVVVVTATGNLRLMHGSEVAAATTVKAGSALVATKVA